MSDEQNCIRIGHLLLACVKPSNAQISIWTLVEPKVCSYFPTLTTNCSSMDSNVDSQAANHLQL